MPRKKAPNLFHVTHERAGLVFGSNLSTDEKIVLLCLDWYLFDDNEILINFPMISRATSLSKEQVDLTLATLASKGIIPRLPQEDEGLIFGASGL